MLVRILVGLGIVVMVIAGGIVALVGWVSHERSAYAATAVPYIKVVVPELSTWDPAQAKSVMDPDVLKQLPDEKLGRVLAFLSRLGHLKSMDEPVFTNVWSGTSTGTGAMTLVTYSIHAHFDAGDGDIVLRLHDRDGKFTVYSFNVNSEALMTAPNKS